MKDKYDKLAYYASLSLISLILLAGSLLLLNLENMIDIIFGF
jgi:hypothetical protein